MMSAPHPLAECLIQRLQPGAESPVLDFGAGSGRNGKALRKAGFCVVALDDRIAASAMPFAGIARHFSAAISTHGLLHGTAADIAGRVAAIAEHLEPGGLLCATFGSINDSRFGRGRRLDASTFAPLDGDERGVPHTYFDRWELYEMLEVHFCVESIDEHRVDGVAGRWAHPERPLEGAAHWFVVGTKR